MSILKIALYILTITGAFACGFWELKLKRKLTDASLGGQNGIIDSGFLENVSEEIRCENYLTTLPHKLLFKLKATVVMKFLFVAMLVVEVLFFQH